MHTGEIAEWVAAIAETCSVIVALFLPYYNQYVDNQRKLRNIKMLIRRMTKRAINGDQEAIDHLETILVTSYLKTMNARTEDVIDCGRQILDILQSASDNLNEEQKRNIQQLLDEIDTK